MTIEATGNQCRPWPRNIKAALIDMDGTLYDSMPRHTEAWHLMVSDLGIESTRDEFYLYEGMTGAATVNLLFRRAYGRDATPAEAAELYKRKTEIFAAMPPVEVMPGAKELVDTLTAHNVMTILVTGSGQNTLLNRLSNDFQGAFPEEHRVTSRDVAHGKPNPEPYLKGLSIAGVAPSEAIVLENAPLGVEAGVRAGVFTVAVTTGPIPRKEFEAAGADIIFPSMPDCVEYFKNVLFAK